jgi:hypothetical protein
MARAAAVALAGWLAAAPAHAGTLSPRQGEACRLLMAPSERSSVQRVAPGAVYAGGATTPGQTGCILRARTGAAVSLYVIHTRSAKDAVAGLQVLTHAPFPQPAHRVSGIGTAALGVYGHDTGRAGVSAAILWAKGSVTYSVTAAARQGSPSSLYAATLSLCRSLDRHVA